MSNDNSATQNLTGSITRQSNKIRILFALWLLFTLWTAWGTISNGLTALQESGETPDQFPAFDPSPFLLCLNLWGLAAALFVGVIVRNPYRWLNGKRLVFGCIAVAMMLGRLVSGGLGGLPVCFMLDELATLGHLTTVENAVGLAAGYGIQLVSVFQDVAQMRDLYKGRWASFIGNAGVRALFNLDDYETAEYWSKFIGGQLVETRSRQVDIYGYYNSEGVSETMRPLFPPDKIMMDFASGKMLVLAQGAHPIITERVPYWLDTNLKGLWDDPRAPVPPLWRHESASSPPPSESTPQPEPEKKQEWWQTGDLFPRYPNVVISTETKPRPKEK